MIDSAQEESKDRPYICPCGKNYLSYPALFTHIKQKHQGTVPPSLFSPPGKSFAPKPPTSVDGLVNMLTTPSTTFARRLVTLLLYRAQKSYRTLLWGRRR